MPRPHAVQAAQLSQVIPPPRAASCASQRQLSLNKRLLFAIVLIEEEAAVLLFRDGVTFDTESHFGRIFAAGSAENLAVGQNQRVAPIMQFGVENDINIFYHEQ